MLPSGGDAGYVFIFDISAATCCSYNNDFDAHVQCYHLVVMLVMCLLVIQVLPPGVHVMINADAHVQYYHLVVMLVMYLFVI